MNFNMTCQFFSNGDPKIEIYENGEYRRIINNKLVRVKSKSSGFVIEPNDRGIVEKVNFMFNTSVDLNLFEAEMQHDKVLSGLISQMRGLKPIFTASVFEAMIKAIVEQQIALKAAISIQGKLIKRFGKKIEGHYAFPTREAIRTADIEELRSCGLSYSKAQYVKNIASSEIDFESLKNESFEEIYEQLISIKGVGPWTAEYTMVRGMGRLDAIPVDDLGLRKAVGRLYFNKELASGAEVRELSKKWGKWKGYACYYILREKGLLLDKN